MTFDICLNCFKRKGDFEVCPYCGWVEGTVPDQSYHLYPGVVLAQRYIVGTVIGFGGFGVIYRAWDLQLAKVIAIKEFFPSGLVNRVPGQKDVIVFSDEQEGGYYKALSRFLEEARNISRFSDSYSIINILNYFEENNTAYIVMEFLEGLSLRDYLEQQGGSLPVDEALDIVGSVMDGLEVIHKAGIVHRDIHPGNIFITNNNAVKLLDFGSAKLSTAEKEQTLTVVVTQGYAAPEQYRTKSRQGSFTDIYALGATMYKMVTGVLPDEAPDRQVGETLELPSNLGAEIESNQERAIIRAMSLNPDLRFQTIDEFRQALLGDKQVDLPAELLHKRRVRRGFLAAAVSVVVIAGIVATALFSTILAPVKTLESVTIAADSITVLVPLSGEQDSYKDQLNTWQAILDKFMEENPDYQVHLETAPIDKYLAVVENGREYISPTLFCVDYAFAGQPEDVADLDILVASLDPADTLFLDQYQKNYPKHDRVPLGFDFLTTYASNRSFAAADDEEPSWIGSLDELASYSFVVAKDGLVDLLALYQPALVTQPELSLNAENTEAIIQIAQSAEQNEDKTPVDLLKDKTELLVAQASDIPTIQKELPGYYSVIPLTNSDAITATFSESWAVSANASENQQLVAMLFISFLLNSYSQNQLFIQHDGAIPLNSTTFNDYMQNKHSELAFITDQEWTLRFQTQVSPDFEAFTDELYTSIIAKHASEDETRTFLAQYQE